MWFFVLFSYYFYYFDAKTPKNKVKKKVSGK
nr:MAG TPA: hypothetical protein [Caudoviricetes sp.]